MKGNKKVLAVALLLLLVAVSFGTYAIYRSSVDGTATITAAEWAAVIKKDVNGTQTELSADFDLTGADFVCTGGHSKVAGKIAPGDTCTATIVVDLTGSEVDAKVGATLDTTGLNNRFTATVKDAGTAVTQEVAVPYAASNMTKTFTVELAWDGTDNETVNPTDTDTLAGEDIEIGLTLTAHQDMD